MKATGGPALLEDGGSEGRKDDGGGAFGERARGTEGLLPANDESMEPPIGPPCTFADELETLRDPVE